MKKLLSLITLSAMLAGCGSPLHTSMAPAVSPNTPLVAPAVSPAKPASDLVAPTQADPYAKVREPLQAIAHYGPLIGDLDTLVPYADEAAAARTVQTTPAKTQGAADLVARAWASDAQQIWLGWGFTSFSLFGHSRHVYYSESKARLLTIDYGFWGNKRSQYETQGLIVQYAGKYIATVLYEPRDQYAVSGADAYKMVKDYGYAMPTNADIKCLMLHPMLLGPHWVFLNEQNKPAIIVDANTGEVTDGGILLQLLGYLF